jgi:hypothetical protein
VKALSFPSASFKHVQMLALAVFCPCLVGHLKMRLNHIRDVNQHAGGTLLTFILDPESKPFNTLCLYCLSDSTTWLSYGLPRCGRSLKDMNLFHNPNDRWFPMNRFKDSTRSRRRDHVV